jgi:hypothetical protein
MSLNALLFYDLKSPLEKNTSGDLYKNYRQVTE